MEVQVLTKQSLARREVLRGRDKIRRVLTTQPVVTEFLVIHLIPGYMRKAGFHVAKHIGKSTSRNLCKRRMRETYRRMRDSFPSGEIIFRLKQAAEWQELQEDFVKAARKLAGRNA